VALKKRRGGAEAAQRPWRVLRLAARVHSGAGTAQDQEQDQEQEQQQEQEQEQQQEQEQAFM